MESIHINGTTKSVDAPTGTPLLWILRDELGMTGTKFGCGMALCGACTVHLDGQPVRSCVTPLVAVGDKPVTTIEGMEHDHIGRAVQQAWVELGVAQCGYCQAGQIMTAVGLLKVTPRPDDRQIDEAMSGNICRCGTYPRIHAAVKLASSRLS
jgi:isoquinoline 1-oxidoreductase alpha subunit